MVNISYNKKYTCAIYFIFYIVFIFTLCIYFFLCKYMPLFLSYSMLRHLQQHFVPIAL